MIRVAEFLKDHALRVTNLDDADLFGRSAFNRYYYATFLIVRNTLATIDSKWAEPAHKVIPDILRSAVLKKFKSQLKKNLLPTAQGHELSIQTQAAASNLANLLDRAYQLRILADYHPEIRVTKDHSVLTLDKTKSSEAATWPREAQKYSGILLNVTRKLGLI